MDIINKKFKAFTLAEALVTLVIIGVIASITIPQLMVENPTKKGWDTMAEKVAGNVMQATTEILIYDAGLDDFTRLKVDDTIFSVEDADATPKMAKLFSKYLANVANKIDLTSDYFTKDLIDYDKNSTGKKLSEAYSDFFYANDGVIMGFKFYGGCTNTEPNTNPPTYRKKYSVNNICGSIFYDVNGYKKPNKLGSDQYIIPVGKRGIKYEDN
ncbi:MAG: type II secretion system protein [Candidatus Gastranaerophilales bacterium]|nr:type II secretion system protein [Candidatus Gastranaerophilales bacterium]